MKKNSTLDFHRLKTYLSPDQYRLTRDGLVLYQALEKWGQDHISDYSFLVSPYAKAYEGFLKDFFLKIQIIDRQSYHSDHFRVGKTLNPSLRYKRFSIFQRLAELDPHGEELAEILWHAWKQSRNLLFHYFPKNLEKLDRNGAIDRIGLIKKAVTRTALFLDRLYPSVKKMLK